MLEGFSLGNYLPLVDFTARLFRDGKAVISAEVTGIFNRLGTNADRWQARLEKLKEGRMLGRFFAARRDWPVVERGMGLARILRAGGVTDGN